MVLGINNIEQSIFQPQIFPRQLSTIDAPESLTSFDVEDNAIISSQAKMLNELDKFNTGEGNAVNLAVSSVMSKITVSAEANVIQAKINMIDDILDMGK